MQQFNMRKKMTQTILVQHTTSI